MSTATDPGPRVVVADDQTLVRGGFRLILGAAGIPVVAEAADGREAVAAALKHRPDVVLMDIRMPEMDGLEATRRILAASKARADVRIIMLTTFDLDQYVYAALAAGASGFLLKDVSPEHLELARGQRGQARVPGHGLTRREPLDQPPGDGGREQRVAAAHQPDRGDQVLGGDVLEQEAAGPGGQRGVHVLVQVECGQHDDPHVGAVS